MTGPGGDLSIRTTTNNERKTRTEVQVDGTLASWVASTPQTIHIGVATVPVAYIGPVETAEGWRGQGYARLAIESSLEAQRRSPAALSILHGIDDFYPQFGYAQAGPDQYIELTRLNRATSLPDGWRARPLTPPDLPAIRALYDRLAPSIDGATLRDPDCAVWRQLALAASGEADDQCRVVVDSAGEIGGYAWRGKPFWYVQLCERYGPNVLVIGEALAADPRAADAILVTCREWGREEAAQGRAIEKVTLLAPHMGSIADAARHQDATLLSNHFRSGSFMAQVLDSRRFVAALAPEFARRLRAASPTFVGTIRFQTERDEATLTVTEVGNVSLVEDSRRGEAVLLTLPQTAVARLAFGGFPPEDLLNRLGTLLDDDARVLCTVLFPRRHTYFFAADRGVD